MLFVAYRLLEGVELWAVINPNLGMDDTRHDYTRDLHAEPPTCALSTGTSTTTMNSTVPSILAPSILRFYPAHVRRAILITLPNHPFLCVLPPPSLSAGTCATRSCAQASCRSCAPAPSLCRPLCRGARWARPLSPSGISQSTPASSLHNAVRRAPSERQSLRVARLVLGLAAMQGAWRWTAACWASSACCHARASTSSSSTPPSNFVCPTALPQMK